MGGPPEQPTIRDAQGILLSVGHASASFFFSFLRSPFHPLVQHGNQHQCQERGAENAADDDGRQRTLHFRASARGDGHGDEPKAGHQRGHQTGRRRVSEPSITASRMDLPSSRS